MSQPEGGAGLAFKGKWGWGQCGWSVGSGVRSLKEGGQGHIMPGWVRVLDFKYN